MSRMEGQDWHPWAHGHRNHCFSVSWHQSGSFTLAGSCRSSRPGLEMSPTYWKARSSVRELEPLFFWPVDSSFPVSPGAAGWQLHLHTRRLLFCMCSGWPVRRL